MALVPVLTADGDTILTADGFALVVEDGALPPGALSGTIVVPDDATSANAAIIDIASATITGRVTIQFDDFGASLSSGIFGVWSSTHQLFIYHPDFTVIASPTVFASGIQGAQVGSDWAHTFYASRSVLIPPTSVQIRAVSDAGALGTTWTLDVTGSLDGLTVDTADTVAYYAKSLVSIRRWDLINNLALGVWVSLSPSYAVTFLLVHPLTGRVLVLGAPDGSTWGVAEYDPSGTVVRTVALPAGCLGDVMALDPGDPTVYWVRIFTDVSEDFTSFIRIDAAGTATTVATFPVGTGPTQISVSCPFFPTSAGGIAATSFPIRRLRRFMV